MKSESRNLTWAWLATAVLFFAFGTQSAMAAGIVPGSIVGSKHDFSGVAAYGSNTQVCVFCHAPHNSVVASQLWNHAPTAATFTLYTSTTFQGSTTIDQPGAVSKLCLSCHDGTVAVDSFGGLNSGSTKYIAASANLGIALGNDHPIGFTYDAALVALDPGLKAVSSAVTIGATNTGTIATKMLVAGKMECSSCHDVHNSESGTAVSSKLLKVTTAASALCTSCHIK